MKLCIAVLMIIKPIKCFLSLISKHFKKLLHPLNHLYYIFPEYWPEYKLRLLENKVILVGGYVLAKLPVTNTLTFHISQKYENSEFEHTKNLYRQLQI